MTADPYRRLAHRELYRNRWLAVEAHEIVHPTGQPGEHLLVITPPTCAIVVEDGDDLVFVRQARFAVRARVIEVVKGGAEDGETGPQAAARELREELGGTARRWSRLGSLYELPSIVASPVDLYVAHAVAFSQAEPDPNESLEPVRMRAGDAIAAAAGGEISDAVTVAALFRYAAANGFLGRRS
ncbi:MAG TPA: NUDIX hydrolase [Candidatus Tumulicola sp.]|nr:NUDIX hydrolase [Candidatus Tumulicola sp.]